ncbi:MAG: sterol desaturase family protein, partial [Pseudomonadota bacterium]
MLIAWTSPLTWPPAHVALGGVLYFATLYLAFAGLSWGLTRGLLPALKLGRVLDPRPLGAHQVRRELWQSSGSVLIFGVGLLVPWGLLQMGWAAVTLQASGARVLAEVAVLLLWNDVHFYAHHRLLHHPRLFRHFHLPHHRSVVTTPWSTYAFHPVEALMLGSVLIVPMVVWPFSLTALALLPVLSLAYNSVGHANYQALPQSWRWLSNAKGHHLHHACFRGNYGFLFSFMDRGLGTQLPSDAADEVIRLGL